jgi:hypothetical protein
MIWAGYVAGMGEEKYMQSFDMKVSKSPVRKAKSIW